MTMGGVLGGGDAMLTRIVIYQVVGQLLGAALGPYWRSLEYLVNQRTPNAELTPAELAALVERTYMPEGEGMAAAAKWGINPDRFAHLVELQETAPPPEWLAVALRRKLIDDDSGGPSGTNFNAGIAQGTIAKKWAPIIKRMATSLPTPEMALEALLEGQTSEADAKEKYEQWGGDPEFFDLMFRTRGSAPTPVELGVLANRGVIDWDGDDPLGTSFHQGFLEGPWRNKWEQPFREYARYRPPPRTVTALLRNGSLTDEQAIGYFQDYGFTPELAAIYVQDAHHDRKTATHDLARTTIERLYTDRVITRDETKAMLAAEGWSDQDAEYLLQVVDLSLLHAHVNAAISRIRTLYSGYKLNRETAMESLTTLGIVGERQDDLLQLWDLLRVDQMRHLTPAQIVTAMNEDVIDGAEALRLLTDQGYSPHDGWILLATRDKVKAGAEPPRGVPGGAPGFQT